MRTCKKCGAMFSGRDCIACAKAYREANRETINAKAFARRKADPEKAKAIVAKCKAAKPEHYAKIKADYKKKNVEATRVSNRNRKAQKRVTGSLSNDIAQKLYSLQKGKCACGCKQPLGADYHLDHIMPIALGGLNIDENIQLLRAKCNLQKHAKHPVEFMQSRGFLL